MSMNNHNNLLVELFVEELPPKALERLGNAFADEIFNHLERHHLVLRAAVTDKRMFASPRRLAVFIPNVLAQAPQRHEVQKLMPVAVGLDTAGSATPALLKKLAALGADASVVPHLRRESDGKSETLFLEITRPGSTLAEGLQEAIELAIARLPIPKVMTYQLADGWSTVNFVRPAHGLVALHGADVVPVSVLGLKAGHETHGHRFEASADPIVLKDADSYVAQLKQEGAVIASFAARREEIARQLKEAAAKAGGQPIDDDALLDEVTALVERPNVLIGQFEETYLEVPQECLILTMKANQKYFPLLDAKGKLTNKFLIVSNIRPSDPSDVIGGNERVVRPRLADAKFFFDQDRKKTLESRVPALDKVVYHNRLGTQGLRLERVRAIANRIGRLLGDDVLAKNADTAARLAKTDLVTDMVGEFPELQGIMGRYYAQHDGLSDDIAFAIEDHYRPRFAGDELPRNQVGIVVALADKLETLVGMFHIGNLPTGDKDPFALRRHALGVLRILIDKDLALQVGELIDVALEVLGGDEPQKASADRVAKTSSAVGYQIEQIKPETKGKLTDFIYERLAGSLRDQGYSAQEVDAVVSLRPQRLGDIPKRLAAVRAFAALPEAASLAAANKRVGNILKKVDGAVPSQVDGNLLNEPAEVALNWSLDNVRQQADIAFNAGDYTGSLISLAALKVPVDAFFTDVMVNVEDDKLRKNRLALLANLHAAMNRVADLSKLST